MSVRMSIDIQLPSSLKKMSKASASLFQRVLNKIEAILLRGEGKIFKEEGPGWAPLSPVTIAKRRKGTAQGAGLAEIRILQDTGTLRASVTAPMHPQGIRKKTTWTLEVGTRTKYAKYHQYGTSKMPARPFLFIRDDDRKFIFDVVRKELHSQAGMKEA